MNVLAWCIRLLAFVCVSFGIAAVSFQSQKVANDNKAPGKLIALLVAFWCIVALFALAVLAEVYTSVSPRWLAIALTGVDCFLWAIIIIDFGLRHHD